jgi:hypothetical protein
LGKSRVILPKKLISNPAAMARAITNTLNGTALAIKADFEVTTQTWGDKPTFTIETPNQFERTIGTDDENYIRLNDGTRAHVIWPHGKVLVFNTPFQSKTLPRSIASGPGHKGGNKVITRGPVRHPGTAAREWDKAIAQKWDRLFAQNMQRAIDAEVS